MTQAAVEALNPDEHYEVWKRELGSSNIRPHGSGRMQMTLEQAQDNVDRLSREEPDRLKREWDLWEGAHGDMRKPIHWYYFIVKATVVRELV